MARYPDKFVVMKPIGDINDPYAKHEYSCLYSGTCRCFLRRTSALRSGSVKDSDFRIVVPDRGMPDVGENYRVCVKMHTSKNNRYWDLVGYVSDFARYDRVCNIDFQMIKENVIYEDVPGPVIDTDKRELVSLDYEGFMLEGVNVTRDNIVKASGDPVVLAVEDGILDEDAFDTYLCRKVDDAYVVAGVDSLMYRSGGRVGMVYIPVFTSYESKDDEKMENTYYFVVVRKTDEEVVDEDGVLLVEPDAEYEFAVVEE